MKRIFFMLLPIFICVALLFTIQSRSFNFAEMLQVFSTWDFADSLDAFVLMANTFGEIGTIWDSIETTSGLWDTIALIGDLIVTIITGLGQLVLAIGYLLFDFVENILQIVEWLFFYEYTSLN